jgi:Uma2 family endonuclease
VRRLNKTSRSPRERILVRQVGQRHAARMTSRSEVKPHWRGKLSAMATAAQASLRPASTDQRMLVHGVSWKDYVILREALETPGLRMTYCEGVLELMSPSFRHELAKTNIARLIESYALLRDLPLVGYGSMTFRAQAKERGAEPDECYCVGRRMNEHGFPDIVIEVIETSPLLDKLEVYRGFGIPEVWLFEDGAFALHRIAGDHYERVERSRFLPDLDLALVARLAVREDQDEALRELKRTL